MGRFEVITGVERRRRWSDEQKRALVAAAFAPGAVVSDVARQADVCPGQLYRWRQDLRAADGGFAEVMVSPSRSPISDLAEPEIELALSDATSVRIPASTPPALAAAVIQALVRR